MYFLLYCLLHYLNVFSEMQIKSGFEEGKDLILSVMCAMGEEQICAVKEVGGGK
jgi:hypothetical protein